MRPVTVENKHCARCKQILPASQFYRANSAATGLSSYCKNCMRACAKETAPKKTCPTCTLEFAAMDAEQVYCSADCWREVVKQRRESRVCNTCGEAAAPYYGGDCGKCSYHKTKDDRDARSAAGETATCINCVQALPLRKFRAQYGQLDKTCEDCRYFQGLVRLYGYTEAFYRDMLVTQNNRCDLCGADFVDARRTLDHCHITNEPRAFLCAICNTGLGYGADHPDIMENLKELL